MKIQNRPEGIPPTKTFTYHLLTLAAVLLLAGAGSMLVDYLLRMGVLLLGQFFFRDSFTILIFLPIANIYAAILFTSGFVYWWLKKRGYRHCLLATILGFVTVLGAYQLLQVLSYIHDMEVLLEGAIFALLWMVVFMAYILVLQYWNTSQKILFSAVCSVAVIITLSSFGVSAHFNSVLRTDELRSKFEALNFTPRRPAQLPPGYTVDNKMTTVASDGSYAVLRIKNTSNHTDYEVAIYQIKLTPDMRTVHNPPEICDGSRIVDFARYGNDKRDYLTEYPEYDSACTVHTTTDEGYKVYGHNLEKSRVDYLYTTVNDVAVIFELVKKPVAGTYINETEPRLGVEEIAAMIDSLEPLDAKTLYP